MSVAEISEQLNLTSIKDHGWHIQVKTFTLLDKIFCMVDHHRILSFPIYQMMYTFLIMLLVLFL